MRSKLSLTHMLCQDPADPIDLCLCRRRGERKRERPFEGAIRARERALGAVGLEPVQCPRADLRFDAFVTERLERPVAPVDLHDVRLPAVAVALGSTRDEDDLAEAFRVPVGDALPRVQQLFEPLELRDAERAEDVRQPVVEAWTWHLTGALPAVMAEPPYGAIDAFLIRRDRSALSRRDD